MDAPNNNASGISKKKKTKKAREVKQKKKESSNNAQASVPDNGEHERYSEEMPEATISINGTVIDNGEATDNADSHSNEIHDVSGSQGPVHTPAVQEAVISNSSEGKVKLDSENENETINQEPSGVLLEDTGQGVESTPIITYKPSMPSSVNDRLGVNGDGHRNLSIDESFVDAVEHLTVSSISSMESNTCENDFLSSKLNFNQACLVTATEETVNVLPQKDVEAEKASVIYNIREMVKKFDEDVDEFNQNEHLDVIVEKFISLVSCREERHIQSLTSMKNVLQNRNDEYQNLSIKFEEQKRILTKSEIEIQHLQIEIEEMKLHLNETRNQMQKVTDELQESNDEKVKVVSEVDKLKKLPEELEEEKEELSAVVRELRFEIDQMKDKEDHYKSLQEKANKLAQEKDQLLAEITYYKNQLSIIETEKIECDRNLTNLVDQLNTTVSPVLSVYNAHKNLYIRNNLEETNECFENVNVLASSGVSAEVAKNLNIIKQIFCIFTTMQEEIHSTTEKVSAIHNTLKPVFRHQETVNEGSSDTHHNLQHVEDASREQKSHFTLALNVLIDECGHFISQINNTFIERSHIEANIKEFEAVLYARFQEMNEKVEKIFSRFSQFESVTVRCEELHRNCVGMAMKLVQSEQERESLLTDLDFLQKSLSEMENSKNEYFELQLSMKSQVNSMMEKLMPFIQSLFPAESLFADNDMDFLVDRLIANLSELVLVHKFLLEVGSNYRDSCSSGAKIAMDEVLRDLFTKKEIEIEHLRKALGNLDSMNVYERENNDLKEKLCRLEKNFNNVNEENQKLQTDALSMENRYTSLRDKLKLAISKGKSLESKCKDLEHSLQELQSRNEALSKSELSSSDSIINLEFQLAESEKSAHLYEKLVSEKDSVLHQIASILWNVDLAEIPLHKEIINKVEQVSKAISQLQKEREYFKDEFENAQRSSSLLTSDLEQLRIRAESSQEQLLEQAKEKEAVEKTVEELTSKLSLLSEEVAKSTSQFSLSDEILRRLSDFAGRALGSENALQRSIPCNRENCEQYITKLLDMLGADSKELGMLKDSLENKNNELQHLQDALSSSSVELNEFARKEAEHHSAEKSYRAEIENLNRQILSNTDEVEKQKMQKDAIQVQLDESKEKEAFFRDRLAKAVKKGKGLAQQCDSLKQLVDEKETDLEQIKGELTICKSLINEREETLKNLASEFAHECDNLKQSINGKEAELEQLKGELHICKSLINEREETLESLSSKFAEQRDNFNQSIDGLKAEIEQLKGELNICKSLINEKEENVKHLSSELDDKEENIKCLSSDLEYHRKLDKDELSLKGKFSDIQKMLLESDKTKDGLIIALDSIEFPEKAVFQDPIKKIESLGKFVIHLQQKMEVLEQKEMTLKHEMDLLSSKLSEANASLQIFENDLSERDKEIATIKVAEKERLHEVESLKGLLSSESNALSLTVDHCISKLLKHHSLLRDFKKCYQSFVVLMTHDYHRKIAATRDIDSLLRNIFNHLKTSENVNLPDEFICNVDLLKDEDFAVDTGLETILELNQYNISDISNHQRGQLVEEALDHLNVKFEKWADTIEVAKKRWEELSEAFDKHIEVATELSQESVNTTLKIVQSFDSLGLTVSNLEAMNKEKEADISLFYNVICLFINTCQNATKEIENLKLCTQSHDSVVQEKFMEMSACSPLTQNFTFSMQTAGLLVPNFVENCKKIVSDFFSTFQAGVHEASEKLRHNELELKRLAANLEEAENSRNDQKLSLIIDLESKLKSAEEIAEAFMKERDNYKIVIEDLKNNISMFNLKIEHLEAEAVSAQALHAELRNLHDVLSAKDEAIASANTKLEKLESDIYQKQKSLENMESSYKDVATELSKSIGKYNESQQLSERFITEAENLRFLVDIRDQEIASLKKEISSFDVPKLLEEIDTKSHELDHLQKRLDTIVTKLGISDILDEGKDKGKAFALLDVLERGVASVVAELESSKAELQKQGFLLQNTQRIVQQLSRKIVSLESTHHDNEQNASASASSEASGIEEMGQPSPNPVSLLTIAPRATRKASSDHLALTVHANQSTSESDDDDKGRGFKALNTTGFVPVSIRSLADRIDGLCVSGGRLLMREPRARIGVIVYWILLHLWLLASAF